MIVEICNCKKIYVHSDINYRWSTPLLRLIFRIRLMHIINRPTSKIKVKVQMITDKTRDQKIHQIKTVINFALLGYYCTDFVRGTIKIAGAGTFVQIVFISINYILFPGWL